MTQTYRVRYTMQPAGCQHKATDVESIDLECELDGIPARLPIGAYIMIVEDLSGERNVHWTRWPKSYRPGFSA